MTIDYKDMAGDGVHAKVFDMTRYLVKTRSVLVTGAGEGAFEQRLIDAGITEIKSVDIDPSNHKTPGVECQFADLNQSIPFPDQSFTMMYAIEVIEHLHNPKRLLEEAYRVLKPGGYLAISTPNPQSITQRVRYLFSGKLAWWSEGDYLGSGHIHPIFGWLFERLYRGMFEKISYDSQSFQLRVIPKLPAIPMPSSKLFAVNDIYILRRLTHP